MDTDLEERRAAAESGTPVIERLRPLAVDLDGTLLASNMLVESASTYVVANPLSAPRLLQWLSKGRSRLKSELASRTESGAASLPYHPQVLAWLEGERATGRSLVLASASDVRFVRQVADHLGIFDEVVGTTDGTNLKAAAKRDLLVARFGEQGFDYVGNCRDDLPVWAAGGTAHVVGPRRLAAQAGEVAELGRTFAPQRGGARALLRAMRPTQWAKNGLVALPLLTAHLIDNAPALWHTLVAIVVFSLAASSTYLLNDLADVANDRQHPTKRNRPFASGQLSLLTGWLLWPVLALAAVGVSLLLLPPVFLVALGVYVACTITYTFWAKHKAVIDVVGLGGLYTIRIVAGAVAISVPLTMWLLTFSMLFFLSLALTKRVSELARIRSEGGGRAKGRGYSDSDVDLLASYGVASSIGAVVVFALYINDSSTLIYKTPELLWLTVPVLLTWLMRVWLLAHRGEMDEDPIVWAVKDRRSMLAGAVILASFAAASVLAL